MVATLQAPAKRGFWPQLRRLPRAWSGFFFVAIIVFGALFAPQLAPDDPLKQFRDGLALNGTPLPPSDRFLLGTDNLGRDVLSRTLYGARISLGASFLANAIAALIGTL